MTARYPLIAYIAREAYFSKKAKENVAKEAHEKNLSAALFLFWLQSVSFKEVRFVKLSRRNSRVTLSVKYLRLEKPVIVEFCWTLIFGACITAVRWPSHIGKEACKEEYREKVLDDIRKAARAIVQYQFDKGELSIQKEDL